MKHIDHQLQRLLKAASRVPDPSASLPVSLQRQVLAQWQWQRQRGNGGELAVQRLLSWSMVYAGLLLMMCFVWAQYSESRQSSEALSLVNSSIQLSLLP
jgi:hypothetical protein